MLGVTGMNRMQDALMAFRIYCEEKRPKTVKHMERVDRCVCEGSGG